MRCQRSGFSVKAPKVTCYPEIKNKKIADFFTAPSNNLTH